MALTYSKITTVSGVSEIGKCRKSLDLAILHYMFNSQLRESLLHLFKRNSLITDINLLGDN